MSVTPTLGILLAALAAVVATLLLYLLRPPARRLVVPSSLIWERVLRGSKRTSDRLRWWISLLLAATIAALIAVSALGSSVGAGFGGDERTVVIVDNSPTMAARTTTGDTRFEQALAQCRRLMGALPSAAEVMVADSQRQISTPAFESRDAALKLLDSLRVGEDAHARVPQVAANALAGKRYVVSDGVLLNRLPRDAVAVSVFDPVENVGITRFDLEMVPGAPQRYQAFVELTNGGATQKTVTLEINGVGAKRISRSLVVPADGTIQQVVEVSSFDGGPVRAAVISPGDALGADDVAYSYLPMRRQIRVTLVTQGNDYLVKSLLTQPRVRLQVVPPRRYVDRGTDLYVFDRFAPATPPRAPAALFNPGRAAWLPAPGKVVAEPEILVNDAQPVILRNVSLRDLYIETATPAPLDGSAGSVELVRARSGGALMVARDAARRWLWVGFDLEHSNFALHAAFPAFLNNAIQWLIGETEIVRAQPGVVGVNLDRPHVVAMDGSEVPLLATTTSQARFRVAQPGIYTAVNADSRVRIAVSVLDDQVTRLNRSSLKPIDAAVEKATGRPGVAIALDKWTMLLLAGFILLLVDWITYNRRMTV